MRDDTIITQEDREMLAREYEIGGRDGPYPTYAEVARLGTGDFTLCALRAIAKARIAAEKRQQ